MDVQPNKVQTCARELQITAPDCSNLHQIKAAEIQNHFIYMDVAERRRRNNARDVPASMFLATPLETNRL